MGRGGKRPGAGRKPKPRGHLVAALPATVIKHPSVPAGSPVSQAPVEMPSGLAEDEVAVWNDQAPHAIANGTLTPASSRSFGEYCRAVALERRVANSDEVGRSNHISLLKLLAKLADDWMLKPSGKPLPVPAAPEAPVSKLAKFRNG